jgi:hypothetical protein
VIVPSEMLLSSARVVPGGVVVVEEGIPGGNAFETLVACPGGHTKSTIITSPSATMIPIIAVFIP